MTLPIVVLGWLVAVVAISNGDTEHDQKGDLDGKADLSEIYAPVFVGRPPSDAFIGLTRLDSGEIRHYNYGAQRHDDDQSRQPGQWRAYIASFDNGLTWEKKYMAKGQIGADQKSPISGEYVRVMTTRDNLIAVRSKGGIDGQWLTKDAYPEKLIMLKPPVFIRSGKRILVGGHKLEGRKHMGAGTLYSDDDGLTWELSNLVTAPDHAPGGLHKGTRWNHGGVEPTVVELKDGRIWMIMRTSQDNHYESFSHDGGETWEEAKPSRFYATITMPTIGRLADGRLLFLWCNTTPLPELARATGRGEDVFTNRDAIHAAISEDEGETWHGFRELFLMQGRNKSDFAETGGVDRSVHQSQFVEVGEGRVLVSFGQHWLHRSMVIFNVDWLYEKNRSDDFSNGLGDWCVFKFIAGVRGHCAYNRKQGAQLIDHPDEQGRKVLHVRRPKDPTLFSENDGATWNFPVGQKGVFTTRIMLKEGCGGGRISLIDRWFNPTDLTAHYFAMFNLEIPDDGQINEQTQLQHSRWHELRFEWDGLDKVGDDICKLYIDGVLQKQPVPLNRVSLNGISYVHFISTAAEADMAGFLIESVSAEVE